jgi:flavin-binding protein dodecin
MANTEIRKVLKHVREAEAAVAHELKQSGLTTPERKLLDQLSDSLRDLDNLLLIIDLNKSIDKLDKMSQRLRGLNRRTRQTLARLQKVAETVDTTANVVDALVKAFGILVKVGLV